MAVTYRLKTVSSMASADVWKYSYLVGPIVFGRININNIMLDNMLYT